MTVNEMTADRTVDAWSEIFHEDFVHQTVVPEPAWLIDEDWHYAFE